ncbi:MAG: signal peptidase I [Candidatus Omnitrophica bacterium]|nr:signal peptidase I [Candidatus Omnitrophota bacterium]
MLKNTINSHIYRLYLDIKSSNLLFTLLGNSMYPTLKSGWKAKLKSINPEEIKEGDIVIFSAKKIVCHRIIGKFRWNKKYYFIHKGDNQYMGAVFKEDMLIAKVVEVYDENNKMVDKERWQRRTLLPLSNKLLSYTYLLLFLTKRVLFKNKQNKLSRWIRKQFWCVYNFIFPVAIKSIYKFFKLKRD